MTTAAARSRFSIVRGELPSSKSPGSGAPADSSEISTAGLGSPPILAPLRRSLLSRRNVEILAVWTLVGLFIAAQRYLRGPSLQPRLALPLHESLAATCPAIIDYVVPGQEEGNAELLTSHGCGVTTRSPEETGREAAKMLENNRAEARRMKANMLAHSMPDAAMRIAQLVLDKSPAA